MLGEIWKTLLDYLKRTPYWPVLEPVLLAGFLYVGVCVVAYQYIQWRYQVTLDPSLFLQSYLFRQVSVAFVAVVGTFCALTVGRGGPTSTATPAPAPGARRSRPGRGPAVRIVVVLLVRRSARSHLVRTPIKSGMSISDYGRSSSICSTRSIIASVPGSWSSRPVRSGPTS